MIVDFYNSDNEGKKVKKNLQKYSKNKKLL